MTEVESHPVGEPTIAVCDEAHWHYKVYGQRLCSNMPLLESARTKFSKRDITFRCIPPDVNNDWLSTSAKMLTRGTTDFGCYLALYETDDGFLLRWEEKCDFLVSRDGRTIQCRPAAHADWMWARNIFYSVVLAFALHIKGLSNFHASAVALPQGAVGFMGTPGSGKSTLSAAFAADGYPILTDDVLVVKEGSKGIQAYPGIPYVSLSPESMDNLFGVGHGPCRISVNGEKQRLAVEEQGMPYCQRLSPLKRLYLLGYNQTNRKVRISSLSRSEAVKILLMNTHCLPLLPTPILQEHLAFSAHLLDSVSVYHLSCPLGLDQIQETVKRVLEHQFALE